MKKYLKIVSGVLIFTFISLIIVSCKKGDGDPFLSLRSRKARLSGNWKVSSLTSTFSYKNQKHETTYDGVSKKEVYTVKDSIITVPTPTPHDSVFTYTKTKTYTGDIITDFEKNGSYYYQEQFKDDTTGIAVTIEITGLWYFTGANAQNGIKAKEQLAIQGTNLTYNPNIGFSYSIIHQGEKTLDIYEIYELKNKEIILKVDKTETINFVKYTTSMSFTYVPR
ncbi:MAG: hypothetical protein WCQ95_06895 [Bacteroidota bacterium]